MDVGAAVAAMKALGPLAKAAQVAKGKAALETAEAIRTTARQLGKPALAEGILAKVGKTEAAVLEAAGATADEVKALTKISASVEKEAGETIGAAVKTAAGADVKVGKAGYLFSCSSPCVILREKYAAIISKDQKVLDTLVKLEQDAAKVSSARQAAMASQDGAALAKADKEIARIKLAAKELEDGINVKYFKPISVEGEEAAAQALKKVQAEEALAKSKPGARVDLADLHAKATPDRPPGVAADDALWKDYRLLQPAPSGDPRQQGGSGTAAEVGRVRAVHQSVRPRHGLPEEREGGAGRGSPARQ